MGFQSELDTGTVLIDREELAELRSQLADANRNEERAVGERVTEYHNTRKREAETEADSEATEMRLELRVSVLAAKLNTLEAEALDAQRNEERAVDEMGVLRVQLDVSRHREKRNMAFAKEEADKLHTLEAAVRAVRDTSSFVDWLGNADEPLTKLYALVPEVTT